MAKYETEYKSLNDRQKQAVEATEGPVLVVAGPGTGKTQLLSMRVANILRKNDVTPGNILCLTFTDNAARNMRERLVSIIGQPAYHVAIHTFHSFGTDVINHYPDYFTNRQLLQQVDELGRYELLRAIFEGLPHSDPLSVRVGEQFIFLKDTLNVIGWLKQNGVSPAELQELLKANEKFIGAVGPEIAETFADTPSPKHLAQYKELLTSMRKQVSGKRYFGFPEYAAECAAELEQAIAETDPAGRFAKPITAWRNDWCKKDPEGRHGFKDGGQNYRKMRAVAGVYERLMDDMAARGLYDFDDMVMETVHAMERNDELRLNLQERYQYVLVDEFQDTNKAQLRMLAALGDNPVHEGRPNIMAVGDDDQAIYAFQGAEVSNMAAFSGLFRKPEVVNLTENYRSDAGILKAGESVARQIGSRLGGDKRLTAKKTYEVKQLGLTTFPSELAQYDWIAGEVETLLSKGAAPEDIAIIAPRHKYLERLMPYLGSRHVPVAYERRENILDAPIIIQLTRMAELVVALAENRQDEADSLFGEVLGHDFWAVPPETLIRVSLECYDKHKHWLEILSGDKELKAVTAWFVSLARKSRQEPMEYLLDQLIGSAEKDSPSPLRAYYFNQKRYEQATENYLTLLGQLSTLRLALRQWQPNKTLYLHDLVKFVELHRAANLKIVDKNPHTQTTAAVQVMTAYKAKGLEFGTVFLINAQDEVWGPTARAGSSRLSLPRNLPIQPAGESDDDRLRLLFVAMTRAKHSLHITGYSHTLENKLSPALSFLEDSGLANQKIEKPAAPEAAEILATDWAYRFRQIMADKKTLFGPILDSYKLSVTHLNNFIDIRDGGPEYFLVHNLLRFPEAPTPSAAYGDAVHSTLQWAHAELKATGSLPSIRKIQSYFANLLARKHLQAAEHDKLDRRGRDALEHYFTERGKLMSAGDFVERGFNNEGVVVAGANLSGKIDLLHFTDRTILEVRDFKTGKPSRDWKGKDEFEKIKLHKYRQQLLFYKLLVEGSASFSGKLSVASGALEFIETDENGKLVDNLKLAFEPEETARFARLIGAVWAHIMNLDFPDTSGYPKNLKGIREFEGDLIDGKL